MVEVNALFVQLAVALAHHLASALPASIIVMPSSRLNARSAPLLFQTAFNALPQHLAQFVTQGIRIM